jgi:MFS family permease
LYILVQVGIQDYLQGISLILAQQYDYSNTQLSMFFAVTGLATAFAVVVVQPLLDRLTSPGTLEGLPEERRRRRASILGIENTTFWFCVATSAILFVAAVLNAVAWQWICSLLVGALSTLIGMRFIAVFSSAVSPEEQGKVMGGVGAILALSIVIASNDIGELMRVSHHLLILAAAVTVLVPTFFIRKPIRRALGTDEGPGGEVEVAAANG